MGADLNVGVVRDQERMIDAVSAPYTDPVDAGLAEAGGTDPVPSFQAFACEPPPEVAHDGLCPDVHLRVVEVLEEEDGRDRQVQEPPGEEDPLALGQALAQRERDKTFRPSAWAAAQLAGSCFRGHGRRIVGTRVRLVVPTGSVVSRSPRPSDSSTSRTASR